jgi:hypothetical protein
MIIELHVSEVNAAIALFSGLAEKFRDQAIAQSQPMEPQQPEQSVDQAAGGTD